MVLEAASLPCDLEEDILTVGWLAGWTEKQKKSFNKL